MRTAANTELRFHSSIAGSGRSPIVNLFLTLRIQNKWCVSAIINASTHNDASVVDGARTSEHPAAVGRQQRVQIDHSIEAGSVTERSVGAGVVALIAHDVPVAIDSIGGARVTDPRLQRSPLQRDVGSCDEFVKNFL